MTYEKCGLYIDADHLESYAENYARSLDGKCEGESSGAAAAGALRRALRELRRLHDSLALRWSDAPAAPGAVRWLLDNAYLAEQEGRNAAADLERAGPLRRCGDGPLLLGLCETLLRSGLCELTETRMALFLRGFQRNMILERQELSGFPAGLRCALVRALLRLYGGESLDDPSAETTAARLFTALRWLSTADLRETLEDADHVERTLREDPAGVYPRMAEASRADYRRRLSALAKRNRQAEYKTARQVLTLAREAAGREGPDSVAAHVGYWLLVSPLGDVPRERRGGLYIGANILITLFLTLLLGFAAGNAAVAALLLVPVGELVKSLLDFTLLRITKPAHVPRLALEEGVPPEGRTLCAVSALLTNPKDGKLLAERLEEHRLLSRDAGPELRFALLADLPDSREERFPEEDQIISAAREAVEALNRKYGGGFFLLTRPRKRSREGVWSGWERKRGALLETMRLLRGQASSVTVAVGDPDGLKNTKYLLALDSDTRLSPGAAKELIGGMLHPLNAPVTDEKTGAVRRGHGILAPRIGVELSAAGRTDFARVFAGQGGTDPYGGACSELNMDVWDRGGFSGKGVLDIDAYLACMGRRVPDNQMLSHDAVESAFLRSGFVGDVECIDGWPGSVLSYYSRMERWTRGDWQNLPYLFRAGKALPDIERWKLFDSLRRSLVPVLTLAALLCGFFLPNLGLSAAAALLALGCELGLTAAAAAVQREAERTPRFHSALIVGVGGALSRTLLRLTLLPAEAWICLSGAVRALWRMGVSKRRLLEWRTAAQSDAAKRGLPGYYRTLWFPPLAGILLLAFAPSIIGKAVGALWVFTPLCALVLSLPARREPKLSPAERDYLTECARDTFAYFDRLIGSEDHFLPPDNLQVRPPVGKARRTSPTNIGLGLLSLLAGMDLKFTPPARGLLLIEGMLSTMESLPKWRGHLYNWYDTAAAQPLQPRYISTVDSGNLCACLIALRVGLAEYGRSDLAERAAALAAAMDFGPLFDPKRKLFRIGLDPDRPSEPPESWYDLLSSEARLTGYLAVARGDVPREHWRRLSRAQLACGRYRGMASWTGTMFEYLMPELLLPLERDSLLYESAKFCLYVQRRRARDASDSVRIPWGISESAYAALDPAMSYRYKAHGCAGLALKRGMDDELVVSPYSSFLALAAEPHGALKNLRLLEQRGLRGEYGFWEALDYTSSRLYQKDPAIVRSVMAHHQGMSLVAAANALLGGVMRRRFLADPAMRAYLGLLREKVPLGGGVLRRGLKNGPQRQSREDSGAEGWSAEGEGTDFLHPACCLLGSATYGLLCAETGLTRALWGAVSPYVPPRSPLDREKGVDLFLDLGGERYSLLPDAAVSEQDRRWRFSTDSAEFSGRFGDLSARVLVSLPAEDTGERREVLLTNTGQETLRLSLTLRLRPLLAPEKDYRSHPAFYGLGISSKLRENCLLLRRLPRNGGRELWLCLAPNLPCDYDLAPGAASGRAFQLEPPGPEERFLTDPLVHATARRELAPGETLRLRFALGLAYDEDVALESAVRILRENKNADLPRAAAAVIGLDRADVDAAFRMLPALCFPTAPAGPVRQEALWRFGISGDLPIVCAEFDDNARLPWARRLMDLHLFLTGCGQDFDLVFRSRDGSGYQRPLQSALEGALWRQGGELLRDRKGGVHLVETGEQSRPVWEEAALRLAPGELLAPPVRRTDFAVRALPQALPPLQRPVRRAWNEDGMFTFRVDRSLPPRAWQNVLTNGRFGYLATDCGTGHLWYRNARELQLTPWRCRPNDTEGPETLTVELGGQEYPLFAAPENGACAVGYLPGAAVWETRTRGAAVQLTAFVPPDTDARVFLIECADPPPEAALHWRMELLLGGSPDSARHCRAAAAGGFLAAENLRCALAKPFFAMATGQIAEYTFQRAAALAHRYGGEAADGEPVFAARLPLRQSMVLVCGCDAPEKLLALTDPDFAAETLRRTKRYWLEKLSGLRLDSPSRSLDRLVNGWLGYQVLACRLLGRCSVYQSGGAYGFRDQLQDAVNLIPLDPEPARAQILKCCARQYAEGDVQHWWHEDAGDVRGVRTRCSDDLLWLPWALCEYVEKTGDGGLCAAETPYLVSPPLSPDEGDRYEAASATETGESVLLHCRRAIQQVMDRGTGPTGLLPIGSGDWNDGFNTVNGESVWLSWFFLSVAERFAALLEAHGGDGGEIRAFAAALKAAADKAWDGKWYLRGRYADGRPLGSGKNAECRIDSIAQSFALLSGAADPAKAQTALTQAVELLYDRRNHLVRLFDPPFEGRENPGYIACYGPGFRENGGQYTHGAVWLILALFRCGRVAEGWELLRALLPAEKDTAVYRAEPFVLAADVYAAPGHEGEAGWSWYTGAAGWMLRVVIEELLGLRLEGGRLRIDPKLPPDWPGCKVLFRGLEIELTGSETRVNGKLWDGAPIKL